MDRMGKSASCCDYGYPRVGRKRPSAWAATALAGTKPEHPALCNRLPAMPESKGDAKVSSFHINTRLLTAYCWLSSDVVVNVQYVLGASDSKPTVSIPALQIVGDGGCNTSLSESMEQLVWVVNGLSHNILKIRIMMESPHLITVPRVAHRSPLPTPIHVPIFQSLQATMCLSLMMRLMSDMTAPPHTRKTGPALRWMVSNQ